MRVLSAVIWCVASGCAQPTEAEVLGSQAQQPKHQKMEFDSEKEEILRRVFRSRKADLIAWIQQGMSQGDPTSLYSVQQFTSPLLTAAVELKDLEWIDGLSDVFLAALPYLSLETNYLYTHEPAAGQRTVHPLDEPAKMWLNHQGVEVIAESAQFLFSVSSLIHGIVSLPEADRTAAMRKVLDHYPSVIMNDHYRRWIFAEQGPFQVRGWGCDRGWLNHHEYVALRIDRQLCDDSTGLSYVHAVLDFDLWIIAGLVKILAAHERAPDQVPLGADLRAAYRLYLMNASMLVEERFEPSQLTDWNGDQVTGLNFDLGVWRDHPDFAWSGYEGREFPKTSQQVSAEDCGWDVSHARRFVPVFETFRHHPNWLGRSYFNQDFMRRLSNQLLYGAFNGDFEWPMLSNYMTGHNGWYRTDRQAGFGYPPDGLTRVLLDGGYGFWSKYNADMSRINERLWFLIQSSLQKDASGSGRSAMQRGGQWLFDGVRGGALKFSNDEYLDLGADSGLVSTTGSIGFWFQFDDFNLDDDLINLWESPYTDYLLLRRLDGGQLQLRIEQNDQVVLDLISTVRVQADTWHHVLISQDGEEATIYIDGLHAGAKGLNSSFWTDHLDLRGAWVSRGHWNGHSGLIDELRIDQRSMTAVEVWSEYHGNVAFDDGLLGYWPLDSPIDHHAFEWLSTHYDANLHSSNSWSLLQFLPVFISP